MNKRNQHIVPHKKGWAVKASGSKRATSVHPTQQKAISVGRSIAKNQKTELFIHNRKGRIREGDSYGHDPHPPKG